MLDLKTTCLLRGIAGVIFGFFALFFPEGVTLGFDVLFWIVIGLAMALFLFLAITARGNGSIFWFGLSAALLVIGVISILVPKFVAVVLILMIASVAIVNGFTDITLALEHPKTKYVLIPGMIITAIVLLGMLFFYFPGFGMNLILSVVGTCALVFGLFSIILGFYKNEETVTMA
ncbi:MAG: hypothetical protein EHM53_03685 [Methanoregulaceae archaeon]|nr:MAG: hypothetical protein EHM53_03685 [Methanoregulaceae archaeon]